MFENIGVPPNNQRVKEIRSCLVESDLALMQNATSTLAGQRREIASAPYVVDRALAMDEITDAYKNRGAYTDAIWFYSEALEMRRRKVEQLSSLSNSSTRNADIVDVGRSIS